MKELLLLLQICLSVFTASHALIYKRDSRSAMSWITICIFLPYSGALLYYAFGINRIAYKAKYFSKKNAPKRISFKSPLQKKANSVVSYDSNYESVPSENFGIVSQSVSLNKWRSGNDFEVLINGDQTYPAMLNEIKRASHSIYLMTYIFTTDKLGKEFILAMKEAQSRGVDVKVILDGIASLYSIPTASRILNKAGIANIKFSTTRLMPPSFGINLRNHKKLLLIDGHTAFTGGMNIRGINLVEDPKNTKPKQDTHFKFCGPIVKDCYEEFQKTWRFLTEEIIEIPDFSWPREENVYCKLLTDGPDEELDKIELVMVDAIISAKSSIKIVTPYFIPSREFISALNNAALRGVNVEILLPKRSDSRLVDFATRNMLWEILQRGVNVYYQGGAFDHSKLFLADAEYGIIGSANIDPRSLRLNYELVIELINQKAINQLDQIFAAKLAKSTSVKLSSLESRSLIERVRDSICWLFSPYL